MFSDPSLQALLSAGAPKSDAGSVAQAAQASDQATTKNLGPDQALHAETGPASPVATTITPAPNSRPQRTTVSEDFLLVRSDLCLLLFP